jgi:hypothetical protein
LGDLDAVVPALIDEANRNGGKDNITVIAIEVPDRRLFRLPRVDWKSPKVKAMLSYVGLGVMAMIMLIALVMFGWRVLFTRPTPTPTTPSKTTPTVVTRTPTP